MRPELHSDEVLGDLPDPVVLFYIKLWTACDDEGYFEWSAKLLGAQLYPFRTVAVRQRQINAWLAALVGAGRVKELDCRVHGWVPSVPRHRIQAGKVSEAVRRVHLRECMTKQFRERVRSGLGAGSVSESESLSESNTLREERTTVVTEERAKSTTPLELAPWNRRLEAK